jgi:hypothetical protein
MAVSWYTKTIQRFSDPTKHARLYFSQQPLIEGGPIFLNDEAQCLRIHKNTIKWAKDERVIAGVRPYHAYHRHLLKELPKLKGKRVIFLPGSSIDQSRSNPKYLCLDYVSERNRLAEEILLGIRELRLEYGWNLHDEVHFIQVAPVVLPFRATPDDQLVHSLPDAVRQTDEELASFKTPTCFGTTTRKLLNDEFTRGVLQYTLSIYESSVAMDTKGKVVAKKIDKVRRGIPIARKELEDLIRLFGEGQDLSTITKVDDIGPMLQRSCDYNRQVTANMYANVCELTGIEKIVYYGPRSDDTAEMRILRTAAKLLDIPIDSWGDPGAKDKRKRGKGVMKNAKMSAMSAADYKAIMKLKGRLQYWFEQKLGHLPEQKQKLPPVMQDVPVHNDLPRTCPDFLCYRCPFAGLREAEQPVHKCACDFARNAFLPENVSKVITAKCGADDLVAAQKLFQELRNKTITYLDEDGRQKTATEVQLLLEDLRKQGWTFTWIHEDFRLLKERDAFIAQLGPRGRFLTRSWLRFLGDERLHKRLGIEGKAYDIKEWVVPARVPERWSVRPSEFSSACYVARMLSKVDKEKLPEPILPHIWAVSGTTRHKYALQRPWFDYYGKNGTPLWDFTERELCTSFANLDTQPGEQDTIHAFGHADALGLLVNGNPDDDIPLILDYKRSPNEKPSFTVQELLYKRAAEGSAGRCFTKGAVLIVVNRPHFADPDEKKFPVYHIVYDPGCGEDNIHFKDRDPFKKKNARIDGLDELVSRNYKIQHAMLDPKVFLAVRMNECSKGGTCFNEQQPGTCGHPFNKQLCNLMAELLQKGEPVQKYFLDGVAL